MATEIENLNNTIRQLKTDAKKQLELTECSTNSFIIKETQIRNEYEEKIGILQKKEADYIAKLHIYDEQFEEQKANLIELNRMGQNHPEVDRRIQNAERLKEEALKRLGLLNRQMKLSNNNLKSATDDVDDLTRRLNLLKTV